MADHPVQTPGDDPFAEQLRPVHLARADEEDAEAEGEERRARIGQRHEEGIPGVRDVGQEEGREPSGPGAPLQPGEDRRVHRVEIEGERGDHDDHLERRQEVEEQGRSPDGSASTRALILIGAGGRTLRLQHIGQGVQRFRRHHGLPGSEHRAGQPSIRAITFTSACGARTSSL